MKYLLIARFALIFLVIALFSCHDSKTSKKNEKNGQIKRKIHRQMPSMIFDKDGFDKDGYNWEGFNKGGYNIKGLNRLGFNKDGYDRDGKQAYINGFDKYGFDINGYNKEDLNIDGFNQFNFRKDGISIYGHNLWGLEGKDGVIFIDSDGFEQVPPTKIDYSSLGIDQLGYYRNLPHGPKGRNEVFNIEGLNKDKKNFL